MLKAVNLLPGAYYIVVELCNRTTNRAFSEERLSTDYSNKNYFTKFRKW